MEKLSWAPVRHKTIYCAPACGGGCTLEDFNEATEKAQKLADALGRAWRPRVWENLGWHYSAVCVNGKASVREYDRKTYSADIHVGGSQWIAEASTPRKAFEKALGSAHLSMHQANKDYVALREA